MSTKTDKNPVYTGIVAKVMAILGLDEAGKIQKFFKGEIKQLNRNITKLEANKQTNKINFDEVISNSKEEIEDATEAVENAYTAINIREINDNAAMKAFSTRYWRNVSAAEETLSILIEGLAISRENNKEKIKDINEQIAKYKARIAKIK